MKKIILLIVALALVLTGCITRAQETSTKPITFIDGIELGMIAAEVKLAEWRSPDRVNEESDLYYYNNCSFKFDDYEAFEGKRFYLFDESGKLLSYGFNFDKPDPETVSLLLKKILGDPTKVKNGSASMDDFNQYTWEIGNGIELIHDSYGKDTEMLYYLMTESQSTQADKAPE